MQKRCFSLSLAIFIQIFLCLPFKIATSQIARNDHSEKVTGLLEPAATFLGEQYMERVGYFMGNAGDINNDGYEDFLISTFHNKQTGYDAGAAYLILGNGSNIWGYDKELEEADARFLGKEAYDALGYCVSGNSDVNGDGYDDFLLGAPGGNEAGGPKPGHTFLFLGKPTVDWGYNCIARDQADASFVGKRMYDHAGQALAMVGDINRDGYGDFIIGAPLNDDGAEDGGKVYLFLGKPGTWPRDTNIDSTNASFICKSYRANAGYFVSAAGDMNGDGLSDFLIGAPHQDQYGGRVYLIFGRKTANWGVNFDLDSADVIFEGERTNDKAGWGLSCAGDVNRDGFSDILIGAYGNDNGGPQAGKVYLILGKPAGWSRVLNLSEADASWLGEKSNDMAGWSVSGLVDLNYDSCDEILIGALYNDQGGSDAGKLYLIYGATSGWAKDVCLEEIPDYFLGQKEGNYAGFCVAGNDANGDGLGDIWTSAPLNTNLDYRSGKIYLFLSQRDRFEIEGRVNYYSNQTSVPDVTLNLTGGLIDSTLTDRSGNFNFLLPYHRNYILRSAKAKNTDFDATTILVYDAALTLQAAVGLIQLDSLQQKAADADQDSRITAYDAALVARYVVGFKDSCSHVGEWLFNPATRTYTDLKKNYIKQDFKAIIVGNVHGDWKYPGPSGESHSLSK